MKRFPALLLLLAAAVSGCQMFPEAKKPPIVAPNMEALAKPVRADAINKANAYEQYRLLDEELKRDESAVIEP